MNSSFSEKITACLQGKVDKHNERHSQPITLEQLIRVYKRGEKASDSTFIPSKTISHWAMARVNIFLRLAADCAVNDSYLPQDQDIIKGSDRTYEQEEGEPFWEFTHGDFISARSDLLLAHITDSEGESLFFPIKVEEDRS